MVQNYHSTKCYSVRNGRVYLSNVRLPKGLIAAICEQLYGNLVADVPNRSYNIAPMPSFFSLSYNHLVSAFCALVRDLCDFREDVPDDGIKEFKGIFNSFVSSKKIENPVNIPTCTFYYFNGCFYRSTDDLEKAVNEYFPSSEYNNHLTFI